MFKNIFYHFTTRKAVIAFGTIFNDITIVRRDKLQREIERVKVPISYGPREKFLIRNLGDPNLDRPINIQLPRMAFNIVGLNYDGQKKLNTMHKNSKRISGDNKHVKRTFNPVFYKLNFELYLLSKYIDDGLQMVEQIMPWFTPDYTVSIKSIPELGLTDDIPITLQSVNMADNYEEDWIERREIIWTLQFEMKMPYYGPVKIDDVITKAQIDLLVPAPGKSVHDPQVRAETPRSARVTVEPDPINAELGDDFGFSETVEFFNDIKKYDPVSGTDQDIVLKIKPLGIPSSESLGNFLHSVLPG